jgi:hypothetical protein
MQDLVTQLREAECLDLPAGLLPFLPAPAPHRWREVVIALSALTPGAPRYLHLEETIAADTADPDEGAKRAARQLAFLERLPELEQHARDYVAREALDECERRAVEASATIVAAYLRGEALAPPMGTADPATNG